MTIEYGRKDCEHVFRYRKGGWEEGCVPAICIECGAYACLCDIKEKIPKDIFFNEGVSGDANINGRWDNPLVKEKKLEKKLKNNSSQKSVIAGMKIGIYFKSKLPKTN